MPIIEAGGYCDTCQRPVLGRRQGTNHILYALLSIFTCGLFLLVWLIVGWSRDSSPYLCPQCGMAIRKGATGPALPWVPPPARTPSRPISPTVLATGFGVLVVAGLLVLRSASEATRTDRMATIKRLDEIRAVEARSKTTSPSPDRAQSVEGLTDRQRLVLRDETSDAAARERLFAQTLREQRLRCSAVVVAVMKTKGSWEINCGSGTTYRMRFDHAGKFL